MDSYKTKFKDITTFIFDIDGVFTDGSFLVINQEYIRTFHTKDTFALRKLTAHGYKAFIISRSRNEDLRRVFTDFGCTEVVLKSEKKYDDFLALKEKYQLKEENCLYMGDDCPDIPLLKKVGLSACPGDAIPDVRKICHYQSPYLGGKGCVRDVIEQALKIHGLWYEKEE